VPKAPTRRPYQIPVPPSGRAAGWRKCNGPCEPEHWFLSSDPSNRICARCRSKQPSLARCELIANDPGIDHTKE
jgi:hypothetical protein